VSEQLPKGWVTAPIGTLCKLFNGRAFKPSEWQAEGLPIIRIQNLNNPAAKFNYYDDDVEERHRVCNGDLLFAWSGTPGTSFGAHVWSGGPAVLNQHIFKVIYNSHSVDRDYFCLAINHRLAELIAKAHGGAGLAHVTKGRFEETEVILPPLLEQKRIVKRIEVLFSRTRRAQAELYKAQTLIKRYWARKLIEVFNNSTEKIVPLRELIAEGPQNGYSSASSAESRGTLSLRLTATTSGKLDLSAKAVKRIDEIIPEESRFWLRPGDLLIQRANALEHVGAAAIFEGPEKTYIYPDLMMRVRFHSECLRRYVWRYLNSDQARRYFRENATGTSGNMPKISASNVQNCCISLPNLNKVAGVNIYLDNCFKKVEVDLQEINRSNMDIERIDAASFSASVCGELLADDLVTDELLLSVAAE
jgi:type I restriction enzyme S subunit